jgi:hypothetical protein
MAASFFAWSGKQGILKEFVEEYGTLPNCLKKLFAAVRDVGYRALADIGTD